MLCFKMELNITHTSGSQMLLHTRITTKALKFPLLRLYPQLYQNLWKWDQGIHRFKALQMFTSLSKLGDQIPLLLNGPAAWTPPWKKYQPQSPPKTY